MGGNKGAINPPALTDQCSVRSATNPLTTVIPSPGACQPAYNYQVSAHDHISADTAQRTAPPAHAHASPVTTVAADCHTPEGLTTRASAHPQALIGHHLKVSYGALTHCDYAPMNNGPPADQAGHIYTADGLDPLTYSGLQPTLGKPTRIGRALTWNGPPPHAPLRPPVRTTCSHPSSTLQHLESADDDSHQHADDAAQPGLKQRDSHPFLEEDVTLDITLPGLEADVATSLDYDPASPTHGGSRPAPDYARWPYPTLKVPAVEADLYEASRAAWLSGLPPPRLDQTTSLHTDAWIKEATGHYADQMVLHGIRHGFSTQYTGPPLLAPTATYNHSSATDHPEHIDAYIAKETQHGALSGPYPAPPFVPWFVSSPLMSREKSDGDGRRVIVDLSYPDGGINCHIAPHMFDGRDAVHNLPSVEAAVATIAATPPGDIHLSVVDLSRAYRQFAVNPMDWPLLGIYWNGAWAFDCRLPFGSRMSSFVMQSVADFITRALAVRSIKTHMYLDDIIVISPTKAIADRDYQAVLALLSDLGLAVAASKLQPPSPSLVWLGIFIDVPANRLSLKPQKLSQIKTCMAVAAGRPFITKKHLQRLIGLANHLAKVVRAARIFICRLLAALRAATGNTIRVTPDIRADLAWYARHLAHADGRAVIPVNRVVLRVWADACLKGAGASDGSRYYEHVYSAKFTAAHSIVHLEAVNCLAAARVFTRDTHAGGTIEIMCDNRPSVDAFTSGRARDPVLAACARALWFHAAQADVDLRFIHVPGEAMTLADALSRASLGATARAQADALITKLSLSRVKVDRLSFSYKAFC